MKNKKTNILLIGIGNAGRRDDGLGWAFIDFWEPRLLEGWDCEYRYQLQVEDAQLIATYDRVYFVDADRRMHSEGFLFTEVFPEMENSFTSHELTPSTVMHLCQEIYNQKPEAYLLGISGVEFELENGLSETALENLSEAIAFFESEVQALTLKNLPDLELFSLN